MPAAHGDSHNFGRRVRVKRGRIVKPRSLFWEWLLLSADSPLRERLAQVGDQELGVGAFDFLPTLRFFGSLGPQGGEVEAIRLQALDSRSAATRRDLSAIVGRSLALWSWLGAADLHWENLALGVDAQGRTVFGPLDIEMLLSDLALPTETKLLPDPDPEYAVICQHASGVRRVLPYLGKPIRGEDLLTMASAYRACLELLERHAAALSSVMAAQPDLRSAPIRVLLRGTADYVSPGVEVWPPWLDAEREQLARGDIPYFFRLYGRPGIHYYCEPTLTKLARLPLRGDVPQLDPLLSLERHLRSPSRRKLREHGLLALLGAFDHPSLRGVQRGPELSIRFGARTLTLGFPNGEQLQTRRDLRAVVNSVYLPCRCGEVRSVLAPSLTVCKPVRPW